MADTPASLAALLVDPTGLDAVPAEAIRPLLQQVAALALVLAARLPDGGSSPAPAPSLESDPDRLLAVDDAARFLALPVSYVGDLGRRGMLPRVGHGKYVRYRLGDLRTWITRHRDPGVDGRLSVTYSPASDRRRGTPDSEAARPNTSGTGRTRRRGAEQRGALGTGRAGDPRVGGAIDAPSRRTAETEAPEVS